MVVILKKMTDFYQTHEPPSAQKRIDEGRSKAITFLSNPTCRSGAQRLHVAHTRTLTVGAEKFDEFSVRTDIGPSLSDAERAAIVRRRGWTITVMQRNALVLVPHASYDSRLFDCNQSVWPMFLALILFAIASVFMLQHNSKQ